MAVKDKKSADNKNVDHFIEYILYPSSEFALTKKDVFSTSDKSIELKAETTKAAEKFGALLTELTNEKNAGCVDEACIDMPVVEGDKVILSKKLINALDMVEPQGNDLDVLMGKYQLSMMVQKAQYN